MCSSGTLYRESKHHATRSDANGPNEQRQNIAGVLLKVCEWENEADDQHNESHRSEQVFVHNVFLAAKGLFQL